MGPNPTKPWAGPSHGQPESTNQIDIPTEALDSYNGAHIDACVKGRH